MSNLYFSTCPTETSTRGLDIDPNLPCFLFPLFFPGGVDRLTSRVGWRKFSFSIPAAVWPCRVKSPQFL